MNPLDRWTLTPAGEAALRTATIVPDEHCANCLDPAPDHRAACPAFSDGTLHVIEPGTPPALIDNDHDHGTATEYRDWLGPFDPEPDDDAERCAQCGALFYETDGDDCPALATGAPLDDGATLELDDDKPTP